MRRHLEIEKKTNLSSFRKIALGTWRTAYDPSVYGTLRIRMDKALGYIEQFRQKKGRKLTITQLVGKTTADAIAKVPDANAVLRFNSIWVRKHINIFFQVAMESEEGEIDLSGLTIEDVDKKSLVEIIDEMDARVKKVRARKDPQLEKARSNFKKMPPILIPKVLSALSTLMYTFNLNLEWAGIPSDPFGSAMVTSIGSLGLDEAYVPIVPYSRVPILIAPGKINDEAIVEDGEVQIKKMMGVFATFDHRLVDGVHASILSKAFRKILEDPFNHFDKLDGEEKEEI